jgi:hypothetical protein
MGVCCFRQTNLEQDIYAAPKVNKDTSKKNIINNKIKNSSNN